MVSSELVQNTLLGGAALGGVIWAAWERIQKARLQKAGTDANVAVNMAQEQMFTLMTARMTALETDYSKMRDELAEERKHSRMLDIRVQQYQIHVLRLEAMMRSANLEPPQMELLNA